MRNPNTMKAYGHMRSRILSGQFPPGTFLSAQKISKEIGVSRTPVREALRQLENDELVSIKPKLGAVVRALSEEEFCELLEYRGALEVHSAGQAAELRLPHEIEHLGSLLEGLRKWQSALCSDPGDEVALRQLSVADQLFHHAILKISRNQFIRQHFERMDILQRLTMPSLMHRLFPSGKAMQKQVETVFHEHEAIFAAIRRGNSDEARTSMRLHIDRFIRNLMAHRRTLPSNRQFLELISAF